MPAIHRVLIADDHFSTRMGLRALLDRQPSFEVVAEAEDGQRAVELAIELNVDLAILDLRMPKLNGIEAATQIRNHAADIRVAILTTYNETDDVQAAVSAGVDAYLLKGTPREEFLGAIENVLNGQTYLAPQVQAKLDSLSDLPTLTARELETLGMLILGRSNRDIAKSLHISEEAVKSRMKNIFKKLGVADRVGAVVEALRLGLVRLDP